MKLARLACGLAGVLFVATLAGTAHAQLTAGSTLPGTVRLPSAAAAAEPRAPALPPARAPAPPAWVQRDGYVPVPSTLVRPAPAADADALPPANPWSTIDLDKPFADDPLGTNVFTDTKYAPAAVQAAIEAQKNPQQEEDADPTADVWAKPKNAPVGGMGGMGAAGQSAMLQQSYGPSAPVAAAAPASGGGDDGVFTGGSNGFNNRYTPSVGNAIGSSDLIVQMIVEAPEQQTALGTDTIRALMGRLAGGMPPNRIMVYQTRTINNPSGQPSTSISFLMKNNVDAERSRQQATFGSRDIMNGFMGDVAKATKLKITPGTIKVSSAVNDGGMSGAGAAPAAGAAMPGQLPGMMMPGQTGGMMAMPQAVAATPAPAAPAPAKSSATGAGGLLSAAAAVVLAALVAV